MSTMTAWFPQIAIKRYPEAMHLDDELQGYDHIIAADYTPVQQRYRPSDRVSVLYHADFNKNQTMLRNLLEKAHHSWERR